MHVPRLALDGVDDGVEARLTEESTKRARRVGAIHRWEDILFFTTELRAAEYTGMQSIRNKLCDDGDVRVAVWCPRQEDATRLEHATKFSEVGSRVTDMLERIVAESKVDCAAFDGPLEVAADHAEVVDPWVGFSDWVDIDSDHAAASHTEIPQASAIVAAIFVALSSSATNFKHDRRAACESLRAGKERDGAVESAEATEGEFWVDVANKCW